MKLIPQEATNELTFPGSLTMMVEHPMGASIELLLSTVFGRISSMWSKNSCKGGIVSPSTCLFRVCILIAHYDRIKFNLCGASSTCWGLFHFDWMIDGVCADKRSQMVNIFCLTRIFCLISSRTSKTAKNRQFFKIFWKKILFVTSLTNPVNHFVR